MANTDRTTTETRLRAGPIFLLILLAAGLVGTPSFAVDFPSFPDPAYYQQYCLTDNVVGYAVDITATNATDLATDSFLFGGSSNCMDGCSKTLQACRPSVFYQFLWFIGLVVIFGIVGYAAPHLGSVGLVAGATAFLMSIFVATWDVFNEPLALMTKLLPFALIIYIAFNWHLSHDDDDD